MTYDTTRPYPPDLVGHGRHPPQAQWPGGARIALQFVLNYEEGGENATLHGDAGSEQFLSEMFNPPSFADRHLTMEGIYEYGSRVGVWRILREFEKRGLPLTVFGVSMALERHPELTAAFVELGHEIACHGYRWINYQTIDEATERAHMKQGIEIIERLTHTTHGNSIHGAGWYTGTRNTPAAQAPVRYSYEMRSPTGQLVKFAGIEGTDRVTVTMDMMPPKATTIKATPFPWPLSRRPWPSAWRGSARRRAAPA